MSAGLPGCQDALGHPATATAGHRRLVLPVLAPGAMQTACSLEKPRMGRWYGRMKNVQPRRQHTA